MPDGVAFQVHAVDAAHQFCLLRVDDEVAVFTLVVSEEAGVWDGDFAVGEAFAVSPGDVF